jgi:small subunit ribosomal protein S7
LLPPVSEEAAEIDRIMNKEKKCDGQPASPELEQGTPVSEVSKFPGPISMVYIC